MGAVGEFPQKSIEVSWTLRRAWSSPTCRSTNKIIWLWHMAWCQQTDYLYGGETYSTTYKWVTQDQYLLLKLKDELQYV